MGKCIVQVLEGTPPQVAIVRQKGGTTSRRAATGRDVALTSGCGLVLRSWTVRMRCKRESTVVAASTVTAAGALSFPFTRIVGQDDLKLSLLLNVVDPKIGGVLIMGDRGTAKSVAVRALIDLLPDIDVVEGDAFNSHPSDPKAMGPDALERFFNGETLPSVKAKTPLVELPLGATEDRICGTIDIEKALAEGVRAFEPGLLAKANRGILYVDEVNLLDDGLVDVILDSAASGVNTVEREGVSIQHSAAFIMIGSGNPQEGELRPQLLDRFGLSVDVRTLFDRDMRTQIVLDRMKFDGNPEAMLIECEPEQEVLRQRLLDARDRLPGVSVPDDIKVKISEICSRLNVDGLRGDIVTNRAARALVAFEGRKEVTMEDVKRCVHLGLNHRLRKDPLDPIDSGTKVDMAFKRVADPEAFKPSPQEKAEGETGTQEKDKRAGLKAGQWAGPKF